MPPPELPVQPSRCGIDLGPARQVVESAEAVPDPVAGELPADQKRADARHGVLGRAPDHGLAPRVQHLKSLALADRVIAQHRHAVLGQQDADALIGLVGLAVVAVAARKQHARERPLPVRQVQDCP